VRVAAPPVNGAANRALIGLIAAGLSVPPTSVRIVHGDSGRRKVIEVVNIDAARAVEAWPGVRDR
jgi:uncharacterized protein YggU (UPF0235/DUF167 family)